MNNVSYYIVSSRRYSNRMFWRRKVCKKFRRSLISRYRLAFLTISRRFLRR